MWCWQIQEYWLHKNTSLGYSLDKIPEVVRQFHWQLERAAPLIFEKLRKRGIAVPNRATRSEHIALLNQNPKPGKGIKFANIIIEVNPGDSGYTYRDLCGDEYPKHRQAVIQTTHGFNSGTTKL